MEHVGFFRLLCLSSWFIFKAAAKPMVVNPARLVVMYGGPASATCTTTEQNHRGIGWEASQGAVDMVENVHQINWTVRELIHWDIQPLCFMNSETSKQINEKLNIVVYKPPDSVRLKKCTEPVNEGETCLLQCNIQNVAPIEYLQVLWYKQQVLLKTDTFNETTRIPVEKHVNMVIQASRNDDGAEYWCEAKLQLGAEGPQPPPTNRSQPQSIVVHYKPLFVNDTEIIESGDQEIVLNCTVKANPPPEYVWEAPDPKKEFQGPTIHVKYSEEGTFKCTASNQRGEATKIFIVKFHKSRHLWVLWVILAFGFLLIVVLVFVYLKRQHGRKANNRNPSVAVQIEQGEELVSK